jgi:hypothetical protein
MLSSLNHGNHSIAKISKKWTGRRFYCFQGRQVDDNRKMKPNLAHSLLVFAAVLLLFVSGCEKAVPRTDYFPLRDGNRWEYRLLDMPLLKRLGEGQAVATAPSDSQVSAAAQEDSDLVPKAEFADPSADPAAKPKAAEDASRRPNLARRVVLDLRAAVDDLTYRAVYDMAEQVWSKRNGYVGFQSMNGRNYLLILPPHTGYKWVVTGPAGKDLFYEIESAAATVRTPAGEFKNCAVARQESRDRKEVFRYWFAPNVGLVRRSKFFAGEEVFRQELVEYTVKPATPQGRLAEDREVRKAVEGKNRGHEFRSSREEREHRGEQIDTDKKELDDKVERFSEPR